MIKNICAEVFIILLLWPDWDLRSFRAADPCRTAGRVHSANVAWAMGRGIMAGGREGEYHLRW